MRSSASFAMASSLVLFAYFQRASAESNATCPLSYNWMLNSYQQSPCQVAAYLGGVCGSGPAFGVPNLAPGDYYNGPTREQSNSCRCSSVFYSLLSACAVCQSRAFLNWSAYNFNCTAVFLSIFVGEIPATTNVAAWAYQNVTSYGEFNVSIAEKAAASGLTQSSVSTSTSSQTSSTSSSGEPPNPSLPAVIGSSQSGDDNKKIAWGVIGVVGVVCFIASLVLAHKMWRKHRKPMASAQSTSFEHEYAPIHWEHFGNLPSQKWQKQDTPERGRSPSLPRITTLQPMSTSRISLPSLLNESEASTYSPAVESSDMYTTQGGHSPLAERVVVEPPFVKLTPLRRPGGRT
ncbi:hypothetical protein B0H10DRAFT_2010041 [Mycena sp. CBHHK59/15]|nr:hypothetical protein B0H10DRAFT_2010041 [Mycena sp. CBHHK59/15]